MTGQVPPRDSSQSHDTLQRGASVGRYLVLDKLGEGGMGLVYAAYDPELNRKVALKLLRPLLRGPTSPAQARLLREAQAMARVSHPNVISVFDVGTHGDQQVFVAMEFVDGGTLNDWLLKEKRSVREILKLFIEAGRGLAAAHAAGLVHRDFKPENVLLGTDGRVRVTDFGLARLTTDEQEAAPAAAAPRPGLGTRLTQAGAIVGTPLFMSPEQHRRQTPDARSDQFNFCASLYWAIYGSSPLQGLERIYLKQHRPAQDDDHTSTIDTVTAAKEEEGPTLVKEFPKEPRLPASIRRALVRGLALDPSKRFPSMEELLRQLSYDPRVAQRRWAIGAAVTVVLAGGAVTYQRALTRHSGLCQGGERRLEAIWGQQHRDRTEKSFTAASPYATHLLPQVLGALDAYGKGWVAMHKDACEATRLRGEQTEEVLELRMICLDRRMSQLAALTRIFAAADAKVVERSLDAALQLPKLEGCADVAALKSPVPLPEDHATRGLVNEIEEKLAEARALMDSGNLAQSRAVAEEAMKAMEPLQYAPIRAEVLSLSGWALLRTGDPKQAEEVLEEAVIAGEEGRLDEEKARALSRLVYLVGYVQGRFDEALHWKRLAEAAIKRVGSPGSLECDLLNYWGNVLIRQGRFAEGAKALERGAAIAEREFGELDARTNIVLSNWASALEKSRKPELALKLITRSIASFEKTRGANHPTVANQRRVLAQVYLDLKKYRNAYEEIQQAVSIHTAALGPDNPEVAADLDWLALTLQADGLYAEALQEAQRSLRIREKVLPQNSPDLAYSLENIGTANLGLKRPLDAIPYLERAIAIHERNGHEAGETAEARFALARALWESGRDRKRALVLAEQARAGYQAGQDLEHLRAVLQWQREHPPSAATKGGARR